VEEKTLRNITCRRQRRIAFIEFICGFEEGDVEGSRSFVRVRCMELHFEDDLRGSSATRCKLDALTHVDQHVPGVCTANLAPGGNAAARKIWGTAEAVPVSIEILAVVGVVGSTARRPVPWWSANRVFTGAAI
jgi:hypothetical protein